jgi:hypothetical protein
MIIIFPHLILTCKIPPLGKEGGGALFIYRPPVCWWGHGGPDGDAPSCGLLCRFIVVVTNLDFMAFLKYVFKIKIVE